jgi:hypothetical protein
MFGDLLDTVKGFAILTSPYSNGVISGSTEQD